MDELLLIEIFITRILYHCCTAVRSNDKGFEIYVSGVLDSGTGGWTTLNVNQDLDFKNLDSSEFSCMKRNPIKTISEAVS